MVWTHFPNPVGWYHMENFNLVRRYKTKWKLMRIIPHRSVLNSNTRKFQHALHQLLSVKYPSFPWQHKRGWFIEVHSKPSIYWMIKISADSIEFLIAVPEDLLESFKIKLNNFEQWKNCRLEEVDEFLIPDKNVDLHRIDYTRNDIFSLDFDYKEQNTPIADILKLSDEMNPEEMAFMLIKTEAFNREKWKKIADYGWNQWEKGGIVPRRGLNLGRTAQMAWGLVLKALVEVKKVIDDIMLAIENVFMSTESQTKPADLDFSTQDRDRAAILATGGPSSRSKNKMTLPVFKTNMFLGIQSPDRVRREILARSAKNALETLSGDNGINTIKINFKARKDRQTSIFDISSSSYNLMSTDEIGKLEQLPTRELQLRFRDRLTFNNKIEAQLSDVFRDETGIFAGTTTEKGVEVPVHIPVKDSDMLFTPRGVMGSPRMGKDQLVINMIVEARRKHGIGAIVPDVIDERSGHRGMADALRDHIPAEHVIDINLGDFDHPPYLGLHSLIDDSSDDRIASNRIAQELTKFLMGDDIDNHQTKEYLQEFAKAVKGDLIGIKLLCLSKAYREEVIQGLLKKNRDVTALERFHRLSEGRQQQISHPILIRLQQILGDEFLKPIFGQDPNLNINLRKWMREGKVVIFRIPSRDLGEEAVKTIVYWIILVAFLTRIKMDISDDKGVFLVMNEPHQFMSKGLSHLCKRILSEGPKYKFSPIVIFHNLSQIEDRSFVQILLSSSLNWHLFKNSNIKAYQELVHYLEPTFTPEEALTETKRFYYISCWLDTNGEYGFPFMVKAPDLVSKRYGSFDNSHLSLEHSKIYGKPIDQVLNRIMERERIIFKEA